MKNETIIIGDSGLAIPVTELASQGNALLGIRDSGKSYTATMLAEQLMDAHIPIVAFDPIGVWSNLRLPRSPDQGRGYPVVVAGGKRGDLPLTPESAPRIMRSAMENGISLVIDLFDINLSKADWKAIVRDCVRLLLHENGQYGLRHIFIEEAAEFCPQRVGPDQGQVYAVIESLARMGGNSGLGYTLINQRAEEVNKAVLELCACMFLHRQKGRHAITSLGKWLDVTEVASKDEIVKSLPNLKQGQCWVWPAESTAPVLAQMQQKNSFHPNRRLTAAEVGKVVQQVVPVNKFVEQMQASLAKAEKPKSGKVPKASSKSNPLKRKAETLIPVSQADKITKLTLSTKDRRALEHLQKSIDKLLNHIPEDITMPLGSTDGPDYMAYTPVPTKHKIPVDAENLGGINRTGKLQKAHVMALSSLRIHGPQSGRDLALLCGYHWNGTFRNVLGELRALDYIMGTNMAQISLTLIGTEIASTNSAMNTGEQLREFWKNKFHKAHRLVIDALAMHPNGLRKAELLQYTGYQWNGTFRNVLGELRGAGVLVGSNNSIMHLPGYLL